MLLAPRGYWDEMGTIEQETQEDSIGTGQQRIFSWKTGWRMFLDNPIAGVGPANSPWRFGEYEGEGGFNSRNYSGRQMHSVYFTLLSELGSVGTILFALMLLYSVMF